MKYNFETFTNRFNLNSAKYELMKSINPEVGEDIVPLSVADMEFDVAPEISKGLKDYIKENPLFGYPVADADYKASVAKWYKDSYDLKVDKDLIFTSSGVVPAIYSAVESFTRPGEGVAIFSPVYGPFAKAIQDSGRILYDIPLKEDKGSYQIDFPAFEKLLKEIDIRLLLFCNPHNPIGRVWTKEELEKVSQLCLDYRVIVFSDEIHGDLIRPGYKFTSFGKIKELRDQLIISSAPSKTFNTAGLMASNNIAFNEEVKVQMETKLAQKKNSAVNCLGLEACRLAYKKGRPWLEELLLVIDKNLTYVEEFFQEKCPQVLVTKSEATFLAYLDMRGLGMDQAELDEFLEREAQLFLVDGSFFEEKRPCFKRINVACPKSVLKEALKRFEQALEKRGAND